MLIRFRIRTIPLAFRRGEVLPLPLHRILPSPQPLQKDDNPSLRTAFLPPLFRGEVSVIIIRQNFHQISNQSCTIAKPRPFHYPTKIRNIIKGRNLLRLTAARSEFATPHGYYYKQKAPSLNHDRSVIPQKSATLSKVGIYCSFQLQLFG